MKKIYVLVWFSWETDFCKTKAFNTYNEAYQQMKAELYEAAELDESISEDEVEDNLKNYNWAYINEDVASLAGDGDNQFWQIEEIEI